MDKNFINIDDLVRQRLGGGEEREQAGSWGRMHDLLDKEMPQKRPAGMYWRRSFSAIALLLLVAGASIGGYEMIKNKNAASGITTGTLAAATTTTNNTTPVNNELNNDNTTNNNKTTATNENKTINNIATTTKDISGEAKPDAANVPVKEHKKHKTVITAANSKAVAVNNNNSATGDQADNKKENHLAANNKKATVKNTDVKPVAHESTIAKAKETKAIAVTGDKAKNGKKSTADNNMPAPAADSKETMDELALSSSAPSVSGNGNNAGVTKHKTAAKKAAQHSDKVAAKTNGSNTHKAPAIAANNEPAPEEGNGTDNTAKAAHKSSKHTTANKIAAISTYSKPAAKTSIAPAAPVLSATTGNTGNNNSKTGFVKNTHKAQKQVQKLVVSQHMIRISPTQVKFILDTISMENATEEYDLATAPPAFGPQTYEKFMSETDETSIAAVAKDNHAKKSKGSSSLENLNAAFNDMKTKVKGAHFSSGLTAGINGTFFGPSSFKGFQFGVTGNVSFSERLAVQGELKYFHRINNNYTLNDNYYNYTPDAGGYTKTMVVNPYNFSTLHSIELPISIRYCIGNFNFYAGGNFEYSFAINTGAYPLADPSSATHVATMGNDNAPKVKDEDFSSRFGIGYLVGASCQVAPNVMLDFRNVQNVWDNSGTAGAKIVSGQLYRSPSLQLSIGYRLGGNKKNKE